MFANENVYNAKIFYFDSFIDVEDGAACLTLVQVVSIQVGVVVTEVVMMEGEEVVGVVDQCEAVVQVVEWVVG